MLLEKSPLPCCSVYLGIRRPTSTIFRHEHLQVFDSRNCLGFAIGFESLPLGFIVPQPGQLAPQPSCTGLQTLLARR